MIPPASLLLSSPYISVAIRGSFLKFTMSNIHKNNIAKMF